MFKLQADKLNLNLPLICEEVSLIFRWLEVVYSLPPRTTLSRLKIRLRRSESVHHAPEGNTGW